jgi:hypothetical protein
VRRFLEFFAATIRNKNTRQAYFRAVTDFFAWVDAAGIVALVDIEPLHVATYIEALQETMAKPTVKQHLAAIRMLFDWLVTGGILASNAATSVRGPKHVIKRGMTPVLTSDQRLPRQRQALVGASPRKRRQAARDAGTPLLDEYIRTAGIAGDEKSPLFRSAVRPTGALAATAMHRVDAWRQDFPVRSRPRLYNLKKVPAWSRRTATQTGGRLRYDRSPRRFWGYHSGFRGPDSTSARQRGRA